MLPDADIIIACPHCRTAARVFQLISGNTFGAITWTDGWMDAPMMPRVPRITRCTRCAEYFWVASAPLIGSGGGSIEMEGQEHEDQWPNAPHIEPLDEDECFAALAAGLGEHPDLELELRVLTWWRGNDAFREPENQPGHNETERAVANMERVIVMTENGDEDLLLFRAEAQRHLGRFHDALSTLSGVGCSDYWPAKSRQLDLIESQTRDLGILYSPERPPVAPS
jgi:hypothetical protein